MCLAVPGRVVDVDGLDALVDLQGNVVRVRTDCTPGVQVGGWVLIHAGFSITELDEHEAMETWEYLRALGAEEGSTAGGGREERDA